MAAKSWNTWKTATGSNTRTKNPPNTRNVTPWNQQNNVPGDHLINRRTQGGSTTPTVQNTNPPRRWQSWQSVKKPATSQPTARPSVLSGSGGWTSVGSAYDPAASDARGFLRDPASSTGWSWIDRLGRVHEARAPMKNEQKLVLNENQILSLNPDYYNPGHKAVTPTQTPFAAPWLQGFTSGSGGWMQTVDGGYFNPTTWQSWKPGDPIPANTSSGGSTPSSGSISGGVNPFETQLYQSLLKAFGGV